MSVPIVELVEGKAECPNHKKCRGTLVFIKNGPIVGICPECGYHIKTKARNGIPVTPDWKVDLPGFNAESQVTHEKRLDEVKE